MMVRQALSSASARSPAARPGPGSVEAAALAGRRFAVHRDDRTGAAGGRPRRISSRQALVAIRYSQVRNVARPAIVRRASRQARSSVSCRASSACSAERSIRQAVAVQLAAVPFDEHGEGGVVAGRRRRSTTGSGATAAVIARSGPGRVETAGRELGVERGGRIVVRPDRAPRAAAVASPRRRQARPPARPAPRRPGRRRRPAGSGPPRARPRGRRPRPGRRAPRRRASRTPVSTTAPRRVEQLVDQVAGRAAGEQHDRARRRSGPRGRGQCTRGRRPAGAGSRSATSAIRCDRSGVDRGNGHGTTLRGRHPGEGKGRSCMAVVRRLHHHRAARPGDDGRHGRRRSAPRQPRYGKVLVLPPAPDAIELRHLRAFVAVAEELNFGRAATRLFLSQPALSRQIRGLERLVGCDLLRRSTHRVELTLAGDALLDRARRLLADVDDAVLATRSVGGDLERRLAAVVGADQRPHRGRARPAGAARRRRAAARAVRAGARHDGAPGDRRRGAVAAAHARGRSRRRRSCCSTAAAS